MSAIPKSEWRKIGKLYKSGQSMQKVATLYGVSIDAVVYVLRKTSIPRRTFKEANRILFETKPTSFSVRNERNKELDAIGAMLYWAEGYKTSKANGIDFANSDPQMVEIFIRFLRNRYIFEEKRLRAFIYCYSNQNLKALVEFWSKRLAIPPSQFTKPYVRTDYRQDGRKMQFGVIHIRYSDKKLLQDILNLIESYRSLHCVGGRVVNYTTL